MTKSPTTEDQQEIKKLKEKLGEMKERVELNIVARVVFLILFVVALCLRATIGKGVVKITKTEVPQVITGATYVINTKDVAPLESKVYKLNPDNSTTVKTLKQIKMTVDGPRYYLEDCRMDNWDGEDTTPNTYSCDGGEDVLYIGTTEADLRSKYCEVK